MMHWHILYSGRGLAVGRKAVLSASVCRMWSFLEVIFSLGAAEYMWGKSLLLQHETDGESEEE